jgi:hypothetical protein
MALLDKYGVGTLDGVNFYLVCLSFCVGVLNMSTFFMKIVVHYHQLRPHEQLIIL